MSSESAGATTEPHFVCDAMLGGLARWLRAAGYDAHWQYGQDDRRLILLAQQSQAILLTSDSGIMLRNIIRDGSIRALFIPGQLDRYQQLAFVLRSLNLSLAQARCMGCGGELKVVSRQKVREEVPAKAWRCNETFFRCQRCNTVLWRGTHWKRIAERLAHIEEYYPQVNPEDLTF